MDEKKKSVSEETKAISSMSNEVIDFDDIRGGVDSKDNKKASEDVGKKDASQKADTEMRVDADQNEIRHNEKNSDKREVSKQNVASDKKAGSGKGAGSAKKEFNRQDKGADKKSGKGAGSAKKEFNRQDKGADQKVRSGKGAGSAKKEFNRQDKGADQKERSGKGAGSAKKEFNRQDKGAAQKAGSGKGAGSAKNKINQQNSKSAKNVVSGKTAGLEEKAAGENKKKSVNNNHNRQSADFNNNETSIKSSDQKEISGKNTNLKKNSGNKNDKAIAQSKRIADAKAVQNTPKVAQNTTKSAQNSSKKKTPGNATPQKKSGKKGAKIVLISVAAVLAIVYIAGFVYFSNNFYPDVTINGVNVSGMNKATARQSLDEFYNNYVLTLDTIDLDSVTLSGDDISMEIALHDEFDSCLKKQQAYLWFVNVFNHHDYNIGADVTWDEDELSAFYKDLKMLDKDNMTEPVDAHIGVEDGEFAIIKEKLGSTILVEAFKETVEDSLKNVVANVDLKDAGCYKLPEVYETDEELVSEFDAKSEYAGAVITIQLDDLTLEPGMDLYDAVLEKKGDSYTVSKALVEDYVKNLAEEYDTMGKDRTFTTSFNDRKVEVTGTAFGYEMDQTATANALYKALTDQKSTTVNAVFTSKGYTLQGENDIGDTYIEVNLSEQYVIGYKDGKKIAEGDCVSGKESTGNGTCLGLYAIQDKLSPTVLRGQKRPVTKTVTKKNKKGKEEKVTKTTYEYEYESPVTYWIQFNGGFGLHDAAGWRSQYGGSIYYYSGSHGCVNLPLDLAGELYENFEVDDPVIVYFWDDENRK